MSRRVQLICEDPSLTHQSFKAECDIRNIMKKYKKNGVITHLTSMKPQFYDASVVPDYQEALNLIIDAQNSFDSLPSELRTRFGNDPAQFLSFTSNESNLDEMRKLGLANPLPVVQENPSETGAALSPT
jgi:phage internal scaffolding protein